MRRITFGLAKDTDVVVPAEPSTLIDILRSYGLEWEYGANLNYFAPGSGLGIGLVAERGTVYKDWTGDPQATATWPALYVESGRASIALVDLVRAKRAAAAFSAGPTLIKDGRIVDIAAEIRNGGYSGFSLGVRKEQRAVGITASGEVGSGYWDDATIEESAADMLAAGCISAIKADSGGSAGEAERRNGKPVLTAGYSVRKLPSALTFAKVTRVWEPSDNRIIIPTVNLNIDFGDIILTPNFRLSEFVCHCGCGQVSIGPGFAELVSRLQALRSDVGQAIIVTSGYRCAKWDAIQGSSDKPGQGPHTTGTAADIWWKNATVDQMAERAKRYFSGVGRYYKGGFVHVDLRQPALDFIGVE